jgi:RNA polymerase sigma-70 factor (ECF subfamily)
MTEIAAAFEEHRSHLRLVAHRMVGSAAVADDAVQEAWIKLARADTSGVHNPRGWLTTVVARVCLDMLRARTSRREEPLADAPEPAVAARAGEDRELDESIGLAALVVLDRLDPAERIAFVLHDMFAMPFDDIAPIVGRSSAATRQLASRGRRRVQGASVPEVDLPTQRRLVEAFIAAIRAGDVEAMVAVLDPDVAVRVDEGAQVRGARAWARGAVAFQRAAAHMRPVLVDGRVGLALAPGGKVARVLIFAFAGGWISEAEVVSDQDALDTLVIEDLP